MNETNTGGSAFPFVDYDCHGDIMDIHSGMALRDYFAAKAMQSIRETAPATTYKHIAKYAYEMADAMLEARQA